MSLINKMLQELDKRHAGRDQPAVPDSRQITQNLRAVRSISAGSELFWRVMAAIMVVTVAWVVWVAWQIMPRSVVTDLAFQSASRARQPGPKPIAPPPAAAPAGVPQQPAGATPSSAQPALAQSGAAQPAVAQPSAAPAAQPAAPQSAGAQPPAPKPAADPPKTDMLRLATEMTTPKTSRDKPKYTTKPPEKQSVAAAKPRSEAARVPEPASAPRAQATPPSRPGGATASSGRIDKRTGESPRQRAETEFQRAMSQVNQGRMAEGMDGIRAALAADPAYELARQTLVSFLLESKKTDEAASAMAEGLAINPANAGFAVLLARINVERGDLDGALALLKKHASAARNNADYHALAAAIYQRRSRHKEAIDQYQLALHLRSSVGAWWVGLGISQEASERPKDASESFRRAKSTGNLSAELTTYVDRRLKQLP